MVADILILAHLGLIDKKILQDEKVIKAINDFAESGKELIAVIEKTPQQLLDEWLGLPYIRSIDNELEYWQRRNKSWAEYYTKEIL